MISRVSAGISLGYSSSATRRPRTRIIGGEPAVRCRSDARRSSTSSSRSAKSNLTVVPIGAWCGFLDSRDRAATRDARNLGDRRTALLDLLEAVLAQPAHAVAHRDLRDLVGRGPRDRQIADLVVDHHHLVEAHPALVAGVAAARAALGLVGLDVYVRVKAVVAQDRCAEDRALLAVLAQRARQALGDDAIHGAGHEEGL